MARGVWTTGAGRAEAEASVDAERYRVRIVGCREIDLSGLPELRSDPLPRHWVVVVEDLTPELEAERPQHSDPEAEAERAVRLNYLSLAIDPDLLVTGEIEGFPCPGCGERVEIKLAPRREKAHPGHFSCPHCRAHLRLGDSGRWEVAPPGPRRDGGCIFCDAGADSQEHVIPEWISKRLGIRDIISMEGSIQSGPHRRRRPISFASYRAPIFCTGCNTHFKHLEDAVIPVLVPMARGLSFAIGPEERALLARWCMKTAVALLSAEPGDQDSVPPAHRRALRQHEEIAARCWIGIFRWHGEPVISGGRGVLSSQARAGKIHGAYSAMLAFEGFGFYLIAYSDTAAAPEPPAGDHPPMLGIWPPRQGLLHWPPPPTDNRVLPAKLFSGWTPLQNG
jgi:hypothetical protein